MKRGIAQIALFTFITYTPILGYGARGNPNLRCPAVFRASSLKLLEPIVNSILESAELPAFTFEPGLDPEPTIQPNAPMTRTGAKEWTPSEERLVKEIVSEFERQTALLPLITTVRGGLPVRFERYTSTVINDEDETEIATWVDRHNTFIAIGVSDLFFESAHIDPLGTRYRLLIPILQVYGLTFPQALYRQFRSLSGWRKIQGEWQLRRARPKYVDEFTRMFTEHYENRLVRRYFGIANTFSVSHPETELWEAVAMMILESQDTHLLPSNLVQWINAHVLDRLN